ncbi:MAG: helix-turn-helix transcriptional regulator [Candidatus Bipolaricaulaceae bacterium]
MGRNPSQPCCPPGRVRGLAQPWILLSLAQGPAHGYELLARLAAHELDPGALYRTLRSMEEEGLIRSFWDTSGSGPARRVYALTDAGWDYLRAWAVFLRRLRDELDRFLGIYATLKGGEPDVRA